MNGKDRAEIPRDFRHGDCSTPCRAASRQHGPRIWRGIAGSTKRRSPPLVSTLQPVSREGESGPGTAWSAWRRLPRWQLATQQVLAANAGVNPLPSKPKSGRPSRVHFNGRRQIQRLTFSVSINLFTQFHMIGFVGGRRTSYSSNVPGGTCD